MVDSDDVILTFDDDIEIHLPTQAIVNALIARLLKFVPWLFTLDGDFEVKTRRFVFKKMVIAFLKHMELPIPQVPDGNDWINTVILSGITQSTEELTANPWPIASYTYVNEKKRIVYKIGGLAPLPNPEETSSNTFADGTAITLPESITDGSQSENIATGQDNSSRYDRSRQDNSSNTVSTTNEETVSGREILHTGYEERPERQSIIIRPNFNHNGGT